jgi:hypothetical protein
MTPNTIITPPRIAECNWNCLISKDKSAPGRDALIDLWKPMPASSINVVVTKNIINPIMRVDILEKKAGCNSVISGENRYVRIGISILSTTIL